MPRLKSVRGPKRLSKNVIIAQEYHRQNVNKLLITIKLPLDKLKSVDNNPTPYMSNDILRSLSLPGVVSDATNNQQIPELPDLLNIFDFDVGEFDELETELNRALNQPQTERRRSSENRGLDIIEALKASPRRRDLSSGKSENLSALPSKPPLQPVTPTRRRKTTKCNPPLSTRQAANYKSVPANIAPILQSELPGFQDEDDDGIKIESMIFSLKDPLGGSKIKLPVRSRFCLHFECFDYENFCLFYKIPTSIKDITRKNLIQHNFDELARRKNSSQSSSQGSQKQSGRQATYQQIIPYQANFGSDYNSPLVIQQLKLSPYVKIVDNPLPGDNYTSSFIAPGYQSCPFYSCPICSTKFPLNALLISDAFNYFVRITSPLAEGIELVGLEKYRSMGETETNSSGRSTAAINDAHVLMISSDDEEDEKERQESATKQKMKLGNFINRPVPPDKFELVSNVTNYDPKPDDHGLSRDDPIILD